MQFRPKFRESGIARRLSMILVTILSAGAFCNAQDAPLKLVKTITLEGVEGRIDHMSVSPDGRRLFIAALGNNTVEGIDPVSGTRVDTIRGIAEPQGVLYIPESRKLAVASGGDGKVRIYNDELKLVGTVDGLDDADNVRYDPQAKLLYVGYGSGALAVIDPEKPAKVADVKLSGHPESFQLESKSSRIFVNVPSAQKIAVIDRTKRQVITTWPLDAAKSNFPMALDEEHHRLFIGCRSPAKLLVIDTESGKSIAQLDCCGDTDDVFYDGDLKRIYVSGGAGFITVVDQAGPDSYKTLADIATAPGARTSIFAKDSQTLYVAVPHREPQKAQLRAYKTGK